MATPEGVRIDVHSGSKAVEIGADRVSLARF